MRNKKWFTVLSMFVLGVLTILASVPPLAAAASSPTEELKTRFGGVYRRPLSDEPSSLDPAYTTDIYANTVVNQLFDGLLQFGNQLDVLPALAQFWEASVDGLTWTFYLRKGATFHHGREITADDFVYSFTRLLDPAAKSPVANLFQHIQGAAEFREGKTAQVPGLKALDRYTLQITLKEPYTPFLSILATANAKVLPREEVERLGEQFTVQPVGSGPFQFVRWEAKKEIVLQAFDAYYEGRPFLDQVVFKIGKKDVESFTAFLHHEVEETSVPAEKVEEVRKDSTYRTYLHIRVPMLHLLYVGFNTKKEPFTSRKVRQAFNYAINKEIIIREIAKDGSIVANGILPPLPGYDPDLEGYYYNPQRAKQLLAEAGYPGGKGLPVIDLWTSSKRAITQKELEVYKTALAELGVTIEIHQAADWPTFKEILEAGKPLMFRLGWHADIPDPDNFFFPLLFSQSQTNRTFYQNPEVDHLLQKARRENDFLQRLQIYREIEKIAMEDAPWISQYHNVFDYLYQPYVRGVEVNSLGTHYIPMKKIWFKKAPDQQAKRVK